MADALVALGQHSLAEHIDGLERKIRASPQEAGLRLALCHFRALLGDWSRAQDQLNAAVRLDPTFAAAASTCAMALKAEQARETFWSGGAEPVVLGVRQPWIDRLLAAAALVAPSQSSEASALRAAARDEAPAVSGRIATVARASNQRGDALDDEPIEHDEFDWLCDGDARLGTALEVFVPAGYGWLPMDAARRLKLHRPQHLVDLLWAPAEVELQDGRGVALLIPVRYPSRPGVQQDDALALARRTDWLPLEGEEQYAGAGQRVLISDAGDHPLLELREIKSVATESGP